MRAVSAPPNVPPVTTRLLVASPSEVVLTDAATAAGLLRPPDRQILLTRADHVDAVAARLDGTEVELVVGTSALRTGRALTRRWPGAPVALLAAGASAYGPTSEALAGRLARRVERVLHPDLVPGLRPLLLAERAVPTTAVPPEHLRTPTTALPGPGAVPDPTTLVLGRAGAWAGALDRDQQTDLDRKSTRLNSSH